MASLFPRRFSRIDRVRNGFSCLHRYVAVSHDHEHSLGHPTCWVLGMVSALLQTRRSHRVLIAACLHMHRAVSHAFRARINAARRDPYSPGYLWSFLPIRTETQRHGRRTPRPRLARRVSDGQPAHSSRHGGARDAGAPGGVLPAHGGFGGHHAQHAHCARAEQP